MTRMNVDERRAKLVDAAIVVNMNPWTPSTVRKCDPARIPTQIIAKPIAR